MTKKKWQRPRLIVLTRINPEERVLTACKSSGEPETGETVYAEGCFMDLAGGCSMCYLHNIT